MRGLLFIEFCLLGFVDSLDIGMRGWGGGWCVWWDLDMFFFGDIWI